MVFRPDMNCARMAAGADRMCMPEVPDSIFIDAVKQVQLRHDISAHIYSGLKSLHDAQASQLHVGLALER